MDPTVNGEKIKMFVIKIMMLLKRLVFFVSKSNYNFLLKSLYSCDFSRFLCKFPMILDDFFTPRTSDVNPDPFGFTSFWPPGSGSVSMMRIRIRVAKNRQKSKIDQIHQNFMF